MHFKLSINRRSVSRPLKDAKRRASVSRLDGADLTGRLHSPSTPSTAPPLGLLAPVRVPPGAWATLRIPYTPLGTEDVHPFPHRTVSPQGAAQGTDVQRQDTQR